MRSQTRATSALTPMKVMIALALAPLVGAAGVLAFATHIGAVVWN